MYKIKIYKRAIDSITKTIEYISKDNLFYANQVHEYIKKSIQLLELFPYLWVEKKRWYRQIIEPNYKFKIVYKVKWDTIFIVWLYREQKNWK